MHNEDRSIDGKTFQERYGEDWQEKCSRGGKKLQERYGKDYHKHLGKLGGEATKEKHGSEHYSKAGKKGNDRKKELIDKGKQVEQNEKTSLSGEISRENYLT